MQTHADPFEDKLTMWGFLFALSAPAVLWFFTEKQDVSSAEKRALAHLPELSWSVALLDDFPRDFDAYFDDHFALRGSALPYYHQLRFGVFGISPTKEVIVGEQGFLYLRQSTLEFDLLSEEELARWAFELERRQQFLARHGMDYLFVVVPDKTDSYPEHLPAHLRRLKSSSRIDHFCAEMARRTDVPVLNLLPAILAAKDEHELYFRNDPHWNSLGAYLASKAIIEQLASRFPQLELPDWEHFGIAERTFAGGGLARMMGLSTSVSERSYKLPRNEFDGCAVPYPITPPPEPSFGTDCLSGNLRVLMFRDSYASAMAPFLSEVFEHIAYLWMRPNFSDFRLEVRSERPNLVIEERVSRFLTAAETRK